ncbi:uncharacterized protein Z519_05695 [Cladophialophora bantiana CBS 173.52]|uniref:Uncharacterized protein n=1 Tax=Cladophialophora bantiana (strain ATCC 10958 / CBS 173.52 / CDC B-1940 / NIH 8579) TaxID=1442370 RepID=A0A0D2HQJ4_CLAB1|nr:uncharacterized protein Z519_05695 [Cladophialophora bantiana CBS 173.52]KIW93090.1 hypothetical protein Z519_05695 [Cladophialophora bantiana CBS 173.52]
MDEIVVDQSRLSWICEKTAAVLIIFLGPFVGLIGGACLPLIWIYFRVKLLVQHYLRSKRSSREKDPIIKMV